MWKEVFGENTSEASLIINLETRAHWAYVRLVKPFMLNGRSHM